MIRHIISESGNAMVGPSVTGVHRTEADARRHFESIRRNYQRDGYAIADNHDTCFTVNKGEDTCTFAMQSARFD